MTTRARSPYFSSNRASAPILTASEVGISTTETGRFALMARFTHS